MQHVCWTLIDIWIFPELLVRRRKVTGRWFVASHLSHCRGQLQSNDHIHTVLFLLTHLLVKQSKQEQQNTQVVWQQFWIIQTDELENRLIWAGGESREVPNGCWGNVRAVQAPLSTLSFLVSVPSQIAFIKRRQRETETGEACTNQRLQFPQFYFNKS